MMIAYHGDPATGGGVMKPLKSLEGTEARIALTDAITCDIVEGIMVFAIRDGLPITREMATERARNICMSLVNGWKVEAL
jgi:hypothetical protein